MTSRTDSRGCNLASRADLQTIRYITNATTPTVRTRLTTRMCRPKRKLSGKTRKLKESQSIRSIGLATCTNSHLRTTHVREYVRTYVHKPRCLTGARACMGRRGARCRFCAPTRLPRSGARRRWGTSRRSVHHLHDCRPGEAPQTWSQEFSDGWLSFRLHCCVLFAALEGSERRVGPTRRARRPRNDLGMRGGLRALLALRWRRELRTDRQVRDLGQRPLVGQHWGWKFRTDRRTDRQEELLVELPLIGYS